MGAPLDPWAYAPGQMTAAQLRKHKVKLPSLTPPDPDTTGMSDDEAAERRQAHEDRLAIVDEIEEKRDRRAKAAIEGAAALIEASEWSKAAVQVQGDDHSVQVVVSEIVG